MEERLKKNNEKLLASMKQAKVAPLNQEMSEVSSIFSDSSDPVSEDVKEDGQGLPRT